MNISSRLNASPAKVAEILLIEDEDDFRELIARVLTLGDYHVVTAGDGVTGVAAARKKRFDLVITDMNMPGMDGIETMLELHRTNPQLKVIAMSGGDRTGTGNFLPLAEKLGASMILPKPFGRQELLSAVAAVLETERLHFLCA